MKQSNTKQKKKQKTKKKKKTLKSDELKHC